MPPPPVAKDCLYDLLLVFNIVGRFFTSGNLYHPKLFVRATFTSLFTVGVIVPHCCAYCHLLYYNRALVSCQQEVIWTRNEEHITVILCRHHIMFPRWHDNSGRKWRRVVHLILCQELQPSLWKLSQKSFCVFTGSSFLYWQITRICFSLWECPDVFLYYRLFSLTFMYIISIASAQQWRVVKISATVTLLSQLSQEHESVMASEWGLVGSPRLLQTRFYNLCSVHVW